MNPAFLRHGPALPQNGLPPPFAQVHLDANHPLVHNDSSLNQISLEYPYVDLQAATRNFDASSNIGSGSYGGVYRGELKDGTEVAIKVLEVPDEAGFEDEVKVLSKFRHPNLVILMGFARHGTQRSLVYELLAGGDVHKRLHRSCTEGLPFPWNERVSIALDAACGLSHLHHSSPKVFHRDIKTPNILLDKNGTAKMADFGLACLSHASAHRVKQASGTVGYACPLYVQRGVVTEGSEVYSFGMVLLELLTASPPAYVGSGASNQNQIQYLANHIKGDINIVLSLVDTKAQWTPPAARAIGDFALSCINMKEEQRPNFSEIVRTIRAMKETMKDDSSLSKQTPAADPGATAPTSHWQAAAAPAQEAQLMHCPGRPDVVNQAFAPCHRGRQPPGVAPGPQPGVPPVGRHISPSPQLQQPILLQALQRFAPSTGAPRQLSPCNNGYPPGCSPQGNAITEVEKVAPPFSLECRQDAPALFTLECIYSEGVNLQEVPFKQRIIVHRLDSEDEALCSAPLPPLRVGRIFQTAVFDALVADDTARSTISREHFQVWAEESPSPMISGDAGDRRLPCTFCLTNFSGNGTHINEDHLQARGERSMLRHGDLITLSRSISGPDGTYQARFIQFRFDLSESCLREAEWFDAGASLSETLSEEAEALSEDEDALEDQCSGSFRGELAFILEVCGPAVQQVPLESRQLAYSPPLEEEGVQPHLYSSLVVGRAQQLDFWQEVLLNEAFNTLSRQHFEVQTWRSVSKEAPFSFLVRNLSDVNPIHVRGGPEEGMQMAKGEQRHLLDGDEIVLNLNQEHTFWLIFRDLTKSTSIPLSPPSCRYFSREEEQPAFNGACDIAPVSAGGCPETVTRKGHAAAVLRPPVSLFLGKDEDEISTTATPHDLFHDEQEEEEDDDDDRTHVAMSLPKGGGHPGALRPRANSHSYIGHGAGLAPGAGDKPPVRDARGVREDNRRSWSPPNASSLSPPAAARPTRTFNSGRPEAPASRGIAYERRQGRPQEAAPWALRGIPRDTSQGETAHARANRWR